MLNNYFANTHNSSYYILFFRTANDFKPPKVTMSDYVGSKFSKLVLSSMLQIVFL